MKRPLLLDLFCGEGGCAMGYHRAGFHIVGVDIKPQPRYPFTFIQGDVLEVLRDVIEKQTIRPDVIHASPPCQRYTSAHFSAFRPERHPDLVGPVRDLLRTQCRPWVIENVPGAPLGHAIMLCGLMFGLKVFRHRWFESSHTILAPEHPSHRGLLIGKDGMCCVVGHGGGVSRRMREQAARLNRHGSGGQQTKADWEEAMGIDWMTRNGLAQAIPPDYTAFIGRQLIRILENQ